MSAASQSRQLNLDELRRLKWLLGGSMALVSLWTVFFLDIEALSLVAITSALIVAALGWPQLPGRVPALVWKLSVPAIILASAADFYLSPDTLPVLIRLAILLVLYRSISYRRKREDLQLVVLGLFLIVVAGVLTVSLGFAFLLLLFTACALGFLFVINLIDAAETGIARRTEASTAWTRLNFGNFLARLRAAADWRVLGFATALFVAVLVMSGVLFLVIPRFELASGFFLDRYITRKSRTGFTENVKFGDVTDLVRDESVAMRVDLTELGGLTERPYWRMVVLDEYLPGGFRVSPGLKAELLRSQNINQRILGRPPGRSVTSVGGVWTFYIEPGVSRFLPLPGSFGVMRLRDPVPIQTSPGRRLLALRTEPMAMSAFQVEGVEQTAQLTDSRFMQAMADARANPGRFGEHIQYNPLVNLVGPTGDKNEAVLTRLVAEIEGGVPRAAGEFARRATDWLQTHHSYALAVHLPEGEGKDDIVRWLDSSEPGYCEYFASGFAVLARAAGHPARVITGFRGGVLNAFENYYMVRNSDAHAWTEIFDGKSAWVRIDPTPGSASSVESAAAQAAHQEQDSTWSARFDSLRVLWYRRIVNFDSRTQVQLLEKARSLSQDSTAAVRAKLEDLALRVKAWLGRPWNLARAGKAAGVVLAGGVAVWLARKLVGWLRRRSWGWFRPRRLDPIRVEAGRQLGRLRVRRGGQPISAGVDSLHGVVEDLRRLRYGRRETWPEPRGVFKRARQAINAARRR